MFHHTLAQLYALSTQEGKLVLRVEIVAVYRKCGSIQETARRLFVSRNTVRMQRCREEGEARLYDRPRRPKRSSCHTPLEVEERVLELKRERGWGRRRIAYALGIPEGTIHHTSCAATYPRKSSIHEKRVTYPARWAWDEEEPFRLAQVDTKDILDKGILGTKPSSLEARTRLRFLA